MLYNQDTIHDKIVMGVHNKSTIGVYLHNDGGISYSYNLTRVSFTELTPFEGESEPLLLGIPTKDLRAIIDLIEKHNEFCKASNAVLYKGTLTDTEQRILKDVFKNSTHRTWETIKSLAKFDKNEAERRRTEAVKRQQEKLEKKLEEAKAEVARLEALQEQLEKSGGNK